MSLLWSNFLMTSPPMQNKDHTALIPRPASTVPLKSFLNSAAFPALPYLQNQHHFGRPQGIPVHVPVWDDLTLTASLTLYFTTRSFSYLTFPATLTAWIFLYEGDYKCVVPQSAASEPFRKLVRNGLSPPDPSYWSRNSMDRTHQSMLQALQDADAHIWGPPQGHQGFPATGLFTCCSLCLQHSSFISSLHRISAEGLFREDFLITLCKTATLSQVITLFPWPCFIYL